MSPDDPRHGTYAGRKQHIKDHESPCDPCKAAAAKYQNLRQLDAMRGRPRAISTVGAVRRIQALMALGWTNRDIADRLGVHRSQVHKWTKNGAYVRSATLARICAVYDDLSMKLPPQGTTQEKRDASYARTVARRNNWPPPLAWDNIDDPNEQPKIDASRETRWEQTVDHAIVERVLTGEKRPRKLTWAENAEVARRLIGRGLSWAQIEEIYGIKVERYTNGDAA